MSSEKILDFGRKKNIRGLCKYLSSLSETQICNVIAAIFKEQSVLELLNYLFQAISNGGQNSINRFQICKHVLEMMEQKNDVSATQVNAIISRITIEIDQLESLDLISLTDLCVESIQKTDGRSTGSKEILPKLLILLTKKDAVDHEGTEMSGLEFKDRVIDSLCMAKWKPENVTSIATMFLDIPLSPDQHLQVVFKVCKCMSEMNPKEIPPLVNQLLWFCENQHGIPLFLELQNYFTSKLHNLTVSKNGTTDTTNMDIEVENCAQGNIKEIQRAESSVLFHINQSAIMGHSVVKELIKSLKTMCCAPEFILNPFLLSVLLCVSCISSYEDQVFDILKNTVTRVVAEDKKHLSSAWLRYMTPTSINLADTFTKVIESSARERDRIITGLIKFGFVLLNVADSKVKETNTEQLWSLGRHILVMTVKKQNDVIDSVVQEISMNIIGQKKMQFIACLRHLCAKVPLSMTECTRTINRLLDNLIILPVNISVELIRCVLPLLSDKSVLRVTLTMILRKSLYSRETETRQMAVSGLLLFLKHMDVCNLSALSQISSSQSQDSLGIGISLSQADVHGQQLQIDTEATCIELLNILRRCFMQQASVRSCLYEGIYDAMLKNPVLVPHVMDLLLDHFHNYYQSFEETLPPIDFSKVVEIKGATAILKEPIANLLFLVQQVALKAANSPNEDNRVANKLIKMLNSASDRMSKSTFEHFGLDDTINFMDPLPETQEIFEKYKQMLGIFEALMAYTVSFWSEDTPDNGPKLIQLFKAYKKLLDFPKNNSKPSKKDKQTGCKLKNIKLPSTILDLQCVIRMQQLVHSSVPWAVFESAGIVKSNREFRRYVMQVSYQLIQNVKSMKANKIHIGRDVLENCTALMSILYENCVSKMDKMLDFDKVSTDIAIQCFTDLMSFMLMNYKPQLPNFLETVGGSPKTEGLDVQLYSIIETMEDMIKKAMELDESEDEFDSKLVETMLSSVTLLAMELPLNSELQLKVYDWAKDCLINSQITNVRIVKGIVTLVLKLHNKFKITGTLYNHLTQNLLNIYGLIDEDSGKADKCTKFLMLSDVNKEAVLLVVCAALKSCLMNVNWMIERLQAEYAARPYSQYSLEKRQEILKNKERDVSCQVSHCVSLVNNLVRMSVSPGISSETIFKLLSTLYGTLNSLTKYFINRSSKLDPAFQRARFTQLVNLTGKHLAKNYEDLISHIEGLEEEMETNKKKGKKADNQNMKLKVLREAKSRTALVYGREQFEQLIIKLSKKCKINLMQFVKQNASRDFHISSKRLVRALDELDQDDNEETINSTNQEQANESDLAEIENPAQTDEATVPKKKRKMV